MYRTLSRVRYAASAEVRTRQRAGHGIAREDRGEIVVVEAGVECDLPPDVAAALAGTGAIERPAGGEVGDDGLPLSQRVRASLVAAGIEGLAELALWTDEDLLALTGIGRGALDEIRGLVPAPEPAVDVPQDEDDEDDEAEEEVTGDDDE